MAFPNVARMVAGGAKAVSWLRVKYSNLGSQIPHDYAKRMEPLPSDRRPVTAGNDALLWVCVSAMQGVMEAITDRCAAMLRARANNQTAKGKVACVVVV